MTKRFFYLFFCFLGISNMMSSQKIDIKFLEPDGENLKLIVNIINDMGKKIHYLQPDRYHSKVAINSPWDIIIQVGDINVCASMIGTIYSVNNLLSLRRNKSRKHQIIIDFNGMINCETKEIVCMDEFKGEICITLFLYDYIQNKKIKSNEICIDI